MNLYFNITPKRRRLIWLFVVVIAALLMFLSAARVSAASTVYVPDDYSTIQQAVNAAASGDTIIVRDGCYSENIKVTKSDLTIRSENGADNTIISSADGTSDVFELNRSRITISGFTIKNAGGGSGISIGYSSAENNLENNKFSNNERAIHISMFSYLNKISGNEFDETNDYALYLQSGYDSGSGAIRKSSANSIYLNDFYSKINAGSAGSAYYNFWKTPDEKDYVYNGGYNKSRLGNHYVFYDGSDDNGDGIGDTSQPLGTESGAYPRMMPVANYEILTQELDWTFAVLTDLHIGWGIPDYGQPGYGESDNEPGQDYYMTERLNAAVNKINERKAQDNIIFAVVLGDITDTAEYSEFLKAREILNKLEIPYIPLIGNHDIVPYTSDPVLDPDSRTLFVTFPAGRKIWQEGETYGDQMFEKVFWEDNTSNKQKIDELFADFSKQPIANGLFQNYSFSYKNVKFVSLDFASRVAETQLSLPANAVDNADTLSWLNSQLNNCTDGQTILLTHYPLKGLFGGFIYPTFTSIQNLLNNTECNIHNFSGHTHLLEKSKPNNAYYVYETEALSQTAFYPHKSQNKFLRLVKVKNSGDIKTIEVDNFETGFSEAINPFITVFPGDIGPNMPVNFEAGAKNRSQDEIALYTWQFDDEPPFATTNKNVLKLLMAQGMRTVKLTINDIYGNEETVSWNYEIKQDTRPGRKVAMVNGTTLVPVLYTGIDLRQDKYALNLNEWVAITKDGEKLIGGLNTHFELANTDIDLTDLVADVDFSRNKSVVHMNGWPDEIEPEKILYIPSTGKGQVYVCPQADSLDKVKPSCQDATVLTVGETKNGMTVSEINYNGQLYYQVYGITGTGGGELDTAIDLTIEEQIELTKLEYDGEDILSRVAQDIGDHKLPLLLSELKQDKINLTSYLPLIKKLFLPFQVKPLEYKLKFQESIGNEWQGKQTKVWFNFEVEQ
jgi:hypothetical protein